MNCKGEGRLPTEGKVALQVESGVETTGLQSDSKEDRTKSTGSKTMENIPDPSVVALGTTFPEDPHLSCTRESATILILN